MQKNCCRSAAILVVLGLCVVARPAQSRENSWHVLVRGQDADLGETPIVVELKEPLPVGRYVMDTEGGGDATAAQVFEDRGGHYLSAILPCIGAHETVKFALKRPAQDNVPLAGGLSFETEGQNLKVKLGTDLLTEYHLGVGNKPFFFPLNGPTGESYTRTYPMAILPEEDHDHPHQRSCWFTHGNVNGVDFWSEGKRFGTIKETGRSLAATGPVVARLVTNNEWWCCR